MNKHLICVRAVEELGDGPQMIKAIEEMAELQKVLAKDINGYDVLEDEVIDEIADVHIMIQQMAIIYGEEKVVSQIDRKLSRLSGMLDKKEADLWG